MIERFTAIYKRYRLDSKTRRAAREQYLIALDKTSSLPSDCFSEFPEHGELDDYAKERMIVSLLSELGSLKAHKDAHDIIRANKERVDSRKLTTSIILEEVNNDAT